MEERKGTWRGMFMLKKGRKKRIRMREWNTEGKIKVRTKRDKEMEITDRTVANDLRVFLIALLHR